MPRRRENKGQQAYRKGLDEGRDVSLGALYRDIAVSRGDFEGGEEKLVKKKHPPFVRLCKKINRKFPSLGRGAKFQPQYREAVAFLGWELTAADFTAMIQFVMLSTAMLSLVIGSAIWFLFGELVLAMAGNPLMVPLYIFAPLLILVLGATYYVQNYPLGQVKNEQVKALTHVPEIIGYMIMSLKLVPNLERAIEFSADHGRGRIAEEFRKMLWDVQIGVYRTLSEALDALAYRWGKFSSEFKSALMRVRGSVIEDTEAKRYLLLDKTMEEILDSVKTKMEQYARGLSQPATTLFYIGVLLPLILIIILPVGSTFSGAALADPIVMVLIYNIGIPLIAFLFAYSLIKQRPPTYEPPKIPDNYPGLPKKWTAQQGNFRMDLRLLIMIVFVVGISASFIINTEGLPPKSLFEAFGMQEGDPQIIPYVPGEAEVMERAGLTPGYYDIPGGKLYDEQYRLYIATGFSTEEAEKEAAGKVAMQKQLFFLEADNDTTPLYFIFGSLITISMCAFFYLYFRNVHKRKVQLEIMELESEFKESIYVLASRLGENKPVEEALKHTRDFLPDLKISKTIFTKTLDNITLLGMPLQAAIFDKNFGSLKNIPSQTLIGGMKIMVDSVEMGVGVAARTLMSLSMQLTNSEKVNRMLSVLISDITGMMKTMSLIIAPLVLGITTSLQKIVVVTISQIAGSGSLESATKSAQPMPGVPANFSGFDMGSFINADVIGSIATPTQFVFIVALYVLELVIIMIYFTTKIEEDNDVLMKMNLATALPIAVIVFVITMFFADMFISGFAG